MRLLVRRREPARSSPLGVLHGPLSAPSPFGSAGGKPRLAWKHDQAGVQVLGLSWAPTGSSLLFGYWLVLLKDGKYAGTVQRVASVDTSGSGAPAQIVDGGQYPSLSRDGTTLVYTTQKDTGEGGLWVSAADGANARPLIELGPQFLSILF